MVGRFYALFIEPYQMFCLILIIKVSQNVIKHEKWIIKGSLLLQKYGIYLDLLWLGLTGGVRILVNFFSAFSLQIWTLSLKSFSASLIKTDKHLGCGGKEFLQQRGEKIDFLFSVWCFFFVFCPCFVFFFLHAWK